MSGTRYIVVNLPDTVLTHYTASYGVVDTELTGDTTARVMATCDRYADAMTLAESLNGTPGEELWVAKNALAHLHQFIEAELDPSNHRKMWDEYHVSDAAQRLVRNLQSEAQTEEPF